MQFRYPKEIVQGEFAITPDALPGTHDQKSPPLRSLYPERDNFLNVTPQRYFSAEHMQAETERFWPRVWTCAGRVSDLPEVGSWIKYDLGRESFIVVRTGETEIKAYYNVCRHRGNQLVHTDFGTSERFTCSFHGWQWKVDGQLAHIPDVTTFKPEVLRGGLNLDPVRCETWAGFIFINMDQDAAPLIESLSALPELMGMYRMEDMHVVKDVVLEVGANWKTVLEAFLESYHLQQTHAQAMPFVDDVATQMDFFSNGHGRLHSAIGYPSPRCEDRDTLDPVHAFMLSEAGVDPAGFSGRAMDVRSAILAAKRDPANPYGLDYSAFTDSQVADDWNYSVFPNMTFNTHPEGVLIMRFLPHPTDPEKSFYHVWVISRKLRDGVRLPAYMGVEPEVDISGATRPARRYTTQENPELGIVLEQDMSNVEAVQRGLRSRSFDFNKYSEQEQRILQLHAEMDRYLKRPAPGGQTAAA